MCYSINTDNGPVFLKRTDVLEAAHTFPTDTWLQRGRNVLLLKEWQLAAHTFTTDTWLQRGCWEWPRRSTVERVAVALIVLHRQSLKSLSGVR